MKMSLSHSLTVTLSHSHTLSISHSLTLDMLNNFCFHVYAQNTLSQSLTLFKSLIQALSTCWTTFVFMYMLKTHFHTFLLSLSHSHSFSLSHSFNLSFNHSRHAEQLLFWSLCSKVTVYSRKLQCLFWDILLLITRTPDIRVHRAGYQHKMRFRSFTIFFLERILKC